MLLMDNDEVSYLIILGVLEFTNGPMLAYAILKHKMNNDRIKDIRY